MLLNNDQKALCLLAVNAADVLTVDEKAFISYCAGKLSELTPSEYRHLKHILNLMWPIVFQGSRSWKD